MPTQLYLTKGALADGLAKDILANFALVMTQFDICGLLVSHDADLIRVADSLVHCGCRRLLLTLRRKRMTRDHCLAALEEVHEVSVRTLHLLRLICLNMAASVGE